MTMTRVGWLVLVVGVAVVGLAAAEEGEQTYFEVVLAAHQAYDNQEWGASVALYDRAFSMRSPQAGDLYDAACAAALGGDAAKATAWLRAAADQGWSDFDWMEQDEDLASLREGSAWQATLADLRARNERFEAGLNTKLRDELAGILTADQDLRRRHGSVLAEFGPDSAEIEQLKKQIHETDARNQERVLAIIDEVGWPGRSLVGDAGSQAAFLVIQHAPLEIQERYLPLMRQAVEESELEPADLALLEDRVLVRKGLPQIYGSQVQCDPKTWDHCYVLPIRDEATVNVLRARVGLEPLQQYLAQWDITWTPPTPTPNPPAGSAETNR